MQRFGEFLHQPNLEDPIHGGCRVTWISCGRASMAKSAKASADLSTLPAQAQGTDRFQPCCNEIEVHQQYLRTLKKVLVTDTASTQKASTISYPQSKDHLSSALFHPLQGLFVVAVVAGIHLARFALASSQQINLAVTASYNK